MLSVAVLVISGVRSHVTPPCTPEMSKACNFSHVQQYFSLMALSKVSVWFVMNDMIRSFGLLPFMGHIPAVFPESF